MKAAVLNAYNEPLEITEVQIDKPAPREVLVKTAASGVCRSDLHIIEGKLDIQPPLVAGHEPAGVVEQVGSDVRYVQPGDRVIACLSIFCGVCEYCTRGRTNLCVGRGAHDRGPDEPSVHSRVAPPAVDRHAVPCPPLRTREAAGRSARSSSRC